MTIKETIKSLIAIKQQESDYFGMILESILSFFSYFCV